MSTDLFLLAGFLGAGKTTTLSHILSVCSDLSGTVVIVNEAGKLGLDGQWVERNGVAVQQLNNGCVCCTLKTELVELLRNLLSENRPQRILMEASGLANPLAVVETVRRFVDQLGFVKTILIIEAEVWEIRSVLGDAFQQGLRVADLIIINKTEDLEPKTLDGIVAGISSSLVPTTEIFPTSFGRVPPDLFFKPPSSRSLQPQDAAGEMVEAAMAGFITVNHVSSKSIDRKYWEAFLGKWGRRLERIKGQLSLEGQWFYFDSVRGVYSYRPGLPDLKQTTLVLIGREFDESELKASLMELELKP
ncbi:MAG: GTP-binding protein [Deltaproteobacteria bacterium]|jgi:G3E family GTPase|nr:GTP-binding protein [Deltaproteobacteria bacterium]